MPLHSTTVPKEHMTFAQRCFHQADLGDERRVKRLISSAEQLVGQPGRSLPDAFNSPADLKAFYRLMNMPGVTHQAILAPARRETLDQIERLCRQDDQAVLILHDTTNLDYTSKKSMREELGRIGNGGGRGYICHNSLAVTEDGATLGLANQILHGRKKTKKNEKKSERRTRLTRESRLWLHGTEGLPAHRGVVDVCDAGADTTEFLSHEYYSGRRFVVRSGQSRWILPGHEGAYEKQLLKPYVRSIRACGGMVLNVQGQQGRKPRKARRAKLLISYTPLRLVPPKAPRGEHGADPLPLYMVRVWEPYPPAGEKPIEWLLWTNEPVHNLEDALRVIGWYCLRWVVEEYHKAMKTGYRIEECQFTSTQRLEPIIALLSVVATNLLSLRDASRRKDAQTRQAKTIFPREYVVMLSQWRWGKPRPGLSVYDFCYALARLGGHQNRRRDKPPGWLVLWRGWQKLHCMVIGSEIR